MPLLIIACSCCFCFDPSSFSMVAEQRTSYEALSVREIIAAAAAAYSYVLLSFECNIMAARLFSIFPQCWLFFVSAKFTFASLRGTISITVCKKVLLC